jgi:3-oxoadipate enol-lactonase
MITTVHGIDLAFDDNGGGLPVLFVHGFPLDRTLWVHQRRALSARVRCIVPDLRGFGDSGTAGPYSMDQYADDLVGLLDHLDIESAAVCGLSMGGYVAMAMWRRHPARMRALVLCDTRMGPDTEVARERRNDVIALANREGAGAIARAQIGGLVGASTRQRAPDVEASLLAMMARQPVAGIVGALGALRDRPDSRETLRSISVPTLVLVGDEDALTPPADAQAMLDALPESAAARLQVIAGAGHVTCLERPAAVTHALADFLATVPV